MRISLTKICKSESKPIQGTTLMLQYNNQMDDNRGPVAPNEVLWHSAKTTRKEDQLNLAFDAFVSCCHHPCLNLNIQHKLFGVLDSSWKDTLD
jgi:hypothetical protein